MPMHVYRGEYGSGRSLLADVIVIRCTAWELGRLVDQGGDTDCRRASSDAKPLAGVGGGQSCLVSSRRKNVRTYVHTYIQAWSTTLRGYVVG